LAPDCSKCFGIAFAGLWLEGTFVIQIAPGVVTSDLVGPARNADDAAPVGKVQLQFWLVLDRLGERIGFLQEIVLSLVEALCVINKLDGLLLFLGLEKDFTFWNLHRLQGEKRYTGPGEHHVPGFLEPPDALIGFEASEQERKVGPVGEWLVGRWAPL